MPLMTPRAVLLLAVLEVLAPAQTQAPKPPPVTASQGEPSRQEPPKKNEAGAARPESAKPDSSKDFSKQGYVIERWYTRVTAESDGTGLRERTAEVRVLSEAGVKAFAVLTFPYTSANEAMEFDYIRVRKPDGTVVKTPDYNIQDMPAAVSREAPLYSDVHEKHVAVKGLAVGDVLEYLVRVRVIKPMIPGQFWLEYSFFKDAIAKDERLEVNVPFEKRMTVVSPEFKPEMTQEGTRRVYRWAHANLEVKEKDPDEIPRRIPPNPDIQITTFTSWEEVGRWYDSLQKDPLQVTAAIQAKADELTKGLKTDDEKIQAIYNFVSLKFHYIGLDFGIGRYQPHAADDVLGNGYGDCKDKHTLLASLLKTEGIEAWPALIHANRKLDAEVPSPAQFNHVITVVPRGGSFLWLDTTPEVAPYGLLLLTLRDKQALVIPTSQPAKLMSTPAEPPEPQRQEFSMEGKLSAEGTFIGHAQQSYQGDSEVLFRMIFRQVPEAQWRDAVQRFSYGMNFMGDVSNVKVSPPDEIDKPFTISYDYVRKNYSDWENHRITPPLPPLGIEVTKDSKEKKPTEPVLLGGLGKVTYHSRVELPAGYFATAPAKCHLSESFAEYTDDTHIEGGVMTTTRELVVKKPEVPLSEWEGFYKFGRAISDDEFSYIKLIGGGQLAQFAPPLKSRAEEEEELRKTLKDNPKDQTAAARLGSVLYAEGKYAEAIEVMEPAANNAPDSFPLQMGLGQAYLKTGQGKEATAHMLAAVELKRDDPMVLNNVAYAFAENRIGLNMAQQYAEKAVEMLEGNAPQAVSSAETGLRMTYQLSMAWDTLGWVYFLEGDGEHAEEFVRPAWLVGQEAVVGEHLGEIYEKEGKTQPAAKAYLYALAVSSMPVVMMTPGAQNDAMKASQQQTDEITARYQKLTGEKPVMNETWRLPNGEWTLTPAEELRHSREVKLANAEKLSGSAQFILTFKPKEVESAKYVSGESDLKPLEDELKAAHYPLEFPPESGASLVVRVEVNCRPTLTSDRKPATGCVASLVNPVAARPQ